MLWATTKRIRIARAATCWLIRRFLDPEAKLVFTGEDDVLRLEREEGALGFHVKDARYPPVDDRGRIPFETLVEERLPDDPALVRFARIVRDADRPSRERPMEPEAAGLRLISVAFPDVRSDDHAIVAESRLLYDALYCSLRRLSARET